MTRDTEPVPELRRDLAWEESVEQGEAVYRIVDTRFDRRLKIDRRGRDIARLLDRQQSFGDLSNRIADETGKPIEAAALERVLASLDGLGLLELGNLTEAAAGEASGTGHEDSVPPHDVELVIPSDLRFACTSCGSCCVGVNVGPVTEDVVAVIRSRVDEIGRGAGTSKDVFFRMVPEDDESEIRVCQSHNGACTFLDDDGLCRIHRKIGATAKPHVCRLFPFRFVLTPAGIRVGLQMECREILDASRGSLVAEQVGSLRELLKLVPVITTARPFVSLDGETAVGFDEYLEIEAEILKAVRNAGPGGFGRILAGFDVVAGQCRPGSSESRREIDPVSLKVEFYRFAAGLGDTLVDLKNAYAEEGGGIRFHAENLELVVEALRDLPLYAGAVFEPEEGESDRFAGMVTINFWESLEEALAPSNVLSASAWLGFQWFLTRALAVSRTRQAHRRVPGERDLVDAWVAVHMLTRNKRVIQALSGLREDIDELFGRRLGDLVETGPGLVESNPQTDFYLF